MPVFKAVCPVCGSRKTTIRTSKKITPEFQALYFDCLEEDCLTRFTGDFTMGKVLHTMRGRVSQGFTVQENQLNLPI